MSKLSESNPEFASLDPASLSSTNLLESKDEEQLLRTGSVNWRLIWVASVVGLGSFQYGYNIGVVNVPASFIMQWIGESHQSLFKHELSKDWTTFVFSAAVSVFAIGGMIGGLFVGLLADKIGRRLSLQLCNILSVIAGALMCGAYYLNWYPVFHLGRFIIGINAGLVSGIVPMYLTELSPVRLRGTFGSISQFVVTASLLLALILGLPFIFGTKERWQFMFAFTIGPAILQTIALFFIPESPKYTFIFRENYGLALSDLSKLRGGDEEFANLELKIFEREKLVSSDSVSIKQLFTSRHFRWPLFLAVFLMAAQQLSGINAVVSYSTQIFEKAQLQNVNPVWASIIVQIVNVLTTILSVYLIDHRWFGRRLLLSVSEVGLVISSLGLVTSLGLNRNQGLPVVTYLAIFFILLFVFFFACGLGSVPFFLPNELFPSCAQGAANSIAIASNWMFNFCVTVSFLGVQKLLGEFTFLIFAVFCLSAFAFILMFVPETNGRQLDEVQRDMDRRRPACCK